MAVFSDAPKSDQDKLALIATIDCIRRVYGVFRLNIAYCIMFIVSYGWHGQVLLGRGVTEKQNIITWPKKFDHATRHRRKRSCRNQ